MHQWVLTKLLRSGTFGNVIFIESRVFTARLKDLAGEADRDVLEQIQSDLLKNPTRGAIVEGLGGIRKARSANPGRSKGKRGGYRYLFLYLEHKQHIHLLLLFDKDDQADLSNDERKLLRNLVHQVKNA
jgi:hypothetical protein